jgi:hypothetical protein
MDRMFGMLEDLHKQLIEAFEDWGESASSALAAEAPTYSTDEFYAKRYHYRIKPASLRNCDGNCLR